MYIITFGNIKYMIVYLGLWHGNLKFFDEYYFKDIGYYSCKINIIKRLILGVQLNSNICTQVNYDV